MSPALHSTGYLLRLEGLAVLIAATVGFASTGWSWWWFFGLLLIPDLAMLGYFVSEAAGRWTYNITHTYCIPIALGAGGWALNLPSVLMAAWVWAAHIGLDRMLGYGLKLRANFHETHLGPIGRRPHVLRREQHPV